MYISVALSPFTKMRAMHRSCENDLPLVSFVDRPLLFLDTLRVKDAAVDEDISLFVEVTDAFFVSVDVGVQQLVFLHEVLYSGEVLAVVLSLQHVLHLHTSHHC